MHTYYRHDRRVTHKAHCQQARHQILHVHDHYHHVMHRSGSVKPLSIHMGLIIVVPDGLGDVQEMIEGVAHQEPPFKAYSATHPSLITDRHQTAH